MTTQATAGTVEILYSRDGKLYYVSDFEFHRPTNWLGVEAGEDGKFAAYPFAFYEIKSGRSERVPVTHPLVQRYAECEGWPPRGSHLWHHELRTQRDNAYSSQKDAQRTLDFYTARIAMLDTLEHDALEETYQARLRKEGSALGERRDGGENG